MRRILNQNGGAKTDTVVKLVLIFFISLLSFSVGTYVGKQVSDNDHRRAQIEGDYHDVDKHAAGHGEEKGEEKLSEDEIASLTEEFVTKEKGEDTPADGHGGEAAREVASAPEDSTGYKKFSGKKEEHDAHGVKGSHGAETQDSAAAKDHAPAKGHASGTHESATNKGHGTANAADHDAPAAHGEDPHAAGHETTTTSKKTKKTDAAHHDAKADAPHQVANRVAEGQTPAADMKAERKPVSVLPSVAATAVGKYTIQVASYPGEGEAKTHAADLKGKGWNAFYVPAAIQGKTWFRVSVGLFTTMKSATEFRKEFQKEAKVETAIVQKIVN